MNKLRSTWIWLIGLVIVPFVLISCEDSTEEDITEAFDGNIMELISSDNFRQAVNGDPAQSLDSLVKYLNVYPDLVSILEGSGPLTLFAPTNAAFAGLLSTPGFPPQIELISPDVIKGVLTYHVVTQEVLSGALTGGATFTSAFSATDPCSGASQPEIIEVNDNGTLLTGATNEEIDVVLADQEANNGVVHLTESVLIPLTVGNSLTPILGTLAATVLLGSDFSHLAAIITVADCGVTGDDVPLQDILANEDELYTAFLPNNAVIEGAAASMELTVQQLIGAYSAAEWRSIVLNHVVPGTFTSTDVINATEPFTSALGVNISVAAGDQGAPPLSPFGLYLNTGGAQGVPIWAVDIAASNGVAHVIGGILFPQAQLQ